MRRVTVVDRDATTSSDLTDPSDLAGIVDRARAADATSVVVEAEPVDDALTEAVERAGFVLVRTTMQLRRTLPVPDEDRGDARPVTTRPFDPTRDEQAWLDVNNRAFAWHPDQAGKTLDDLHALEREPWFRTDGFLVHDASERHDGPAIDGFCWTKVHADADPPLGEIFVIGVDPAGHGHGLGRSLVLAGLDWLHGVGLDHAMLYVEADNAPARHLYDSLGFAEHQAHRWWHLDL
jgi:mycothiol synthase